MRRIINIAAYLLMVALIYIACVNYTDVAHLQIWGLEGAASLQKFGIPTDAVFRDTRLTWIIIGTLLSGIFIGASVVAQFYFAQKEKLEAYKRELERKMITNSSSTSKIEVLESKIKTLEIALQNALKK